MTIVTLDSTDLPGILADAGVPLDQPKPGDDPADKGVKQADKAAPVEDPDEEDEEGFTAAEREGLTDRTRKAIAKRHRQRREAEEFAAVQFNEKQLAIQRAKDLERELNELKAALKPKEEVPVAPSKPERQNFASEEAYVDAMIQWGVDQRLAEKAEEDRKVREEREKQERINAAGKRIDRARELVPDFTEVVAAIDTPVPPEIAKYMESADMFAELAYHFAKNPEVLLSLAKLTPHQQLVKVGRIESTLTPFEPPKAQNDSKSGEDASDGKAAKAAPGTKETGFDLSKPRSKAAPVMTTVDGTGSAGNQKDSKDMDIRETIADFAKRNKVNLGARKRH